MRTAVQCEGDPWECVAALSPHTSVLLYNTRRYNPSSIVFIGSANCPRRGQPPVYSSDYRLSDSRTADTFGSAPHPRYLVPTFLTRTDPGTSTTSALLRLALSVLSCRPSAIHFAPATTRSAAFCCFAVPSFVPTTLRFIHSPLHRSLHVPAVTSRLGRTRHHLFIVHLACKLSIYT